TLPWTAGLWPAIQDFDLFTKEEGDAPPSGAWRRRLISTSPADSESLGTIIPALALSPMPRTWSQDVPFLHRLLLHYGIYRRYPLRPWPALKNAWRVAWR